MTTTQSHTPTIQVRQREFAIVRGDVLNAQRASTGHVAPCLVFLGWHSGKRVGFISHLDLPSAWLGTKQVLDEMAKHIGADEMPHVQLSVVSRIPTMLPILPVLFTSAYYLWAREDSVWLLLIAVGVALLLLVSRISLAIRLQLDFSTLPSPKDESVWDFRGAFAWLRCRPARLRTGGTIDALSGPEIWKPYATNETDDMYLLAEDREASRLKPANGSAPVGKTE